MICSNFSKKLSYLLLKPEKFNLCFEIVDNFLIILILNWPFFIRYLLLKISHFGENVTLFVRYSPKFEIFKRISYFSENLTFWQYLILVKISHFLQDFYQNVAFSSKCEIFMKIAQFSKISHKNIRFYHNVRNVIFSTK